MNTPWPPIIYRAKIPWWRRATDYLLTALAWALMLYLISPLIFILWHAIEMVFGLEEKMPPVEARLLFRELLPFFKIVLLFSLTLSVFAISRREHFRANQASRYQPPPLPPAIQGQRFGLTSTQMGTLQSARIARVVFAAEKRGRNKITEVEHLPTKAGGANIKYRSPK